MRSRAGEGQAGAKQSALALAPAIRARLRGRLRPRFPRPEVADFAFRKLHASVGWELAQGAGIARTWLSRRCGIFGFPRFRWSLRRLEKAAPRRVL